jgi:cell division protein FtsI/penicillin-binding protein 2
MSSGANVKLTIDFKIQSIVEKELSLWVKTYKARRGAIVIMNPDNGRITAMASYPNFNPNIYYKYKSENFRNIPISYNYEPGSTVKPLIIAWALSRGLIDLDWLYYCRKGYFRYRTLDVHDHEPMGWQNVEGILIHSSNIGMVRIADYLGPINIYRIFKDFGFGEPTNIDLPGEFKGILPNIKKFSSIKHATMSFGQGVAVTPIQLITAYSCLINGGYLLKPFVVDSIVKKNGDIIKKNEPVIYKQIINKKASEEIKKVLVNVVDKGTGKRAKLSYIKIGGKTGTAQIPSSKGGYLKGGYISSFIGFFPAKNPTCVVLMLLEKPREGYYASEVVCPQFKKITQEIMPYVGIKNNSIIVENSKKCGKIKRGLSKLEVLRLIYKKNIHQN